MEQLRVQAEEAHRLERQRPGRRNRRARRDAGDAAGVTGEGIEVLLMRRNKIGKGRGRGGCMCNGRTVSREQ